MRILGLVCKSNIKETIPGCNGEIKFTSGSKYKAKQDKDDKKRFYIRDDNNNELLTIVEKILNDFNIIMNMEY